MAMYFVASPCTSVRGKRLFGSGAGLPLPPLPEKFAMTYPNTTLLSSSVNALATVGMSAVTATSCNMPTSLMTRTTRSPALALVWNESERYWTWR